MQNETALTLQRELEELEALGADLTAVDDTSLSLRQSDPRTRAVHERTWTTRQVLAALQAERRQHGEPARLVVTLPVEIPIGQRTGPVVNRLMGSARARVLVMGFAIRKHALELISDCLGRGVRVDLVLDPASNPNVQLAPHGCLRIWRPREVERLMHAKVIVVDPGTSTSRALVGSANFTKSGLGVEGPSAEHNWEVGVLVGRSIADDIWRVFEQHLRGGDEDGPGKWLERHVPDF